MAAASAGSGRQEHDVHRELHRLRAECDAAHSANEVLSAALTEGLAALRAELQARQGHLERDVRGVRGELQELRGALGALDSGSGGLAPCEGRSNPGLWRGQGEAQAPLGDARSLGAEALQRCLISRRETEVGAALRVEVDRLAADLRGEIRRLGDEFLRRSLVSTREPRDDAREADGPWERLSEASQPWQTPRCGERTPTPPPPAAEAARGDGEAIRFGGGYAEDLLDQAAAEPPQGRTNSLRLARRSASPVPLPPRPASSNARLSAALRELAATRGPGAGRPNSSRRAWPPSAEQRPGSRGWHW